MTHEVQPAAPVRRAFQIYLYAVCFVTVLVALFAVAESAYGLFRVITPDTTTIAAYDPRSENPFQVATSRKAERRRGTAQFIQWGLIGAAAGLIFRYHQKQATALRAELEALANPPAPVVPPMPDLAPTEDVTLPAPRTPAKRRAPRRKT